MAQVRKFPIKYLEENLVFHAQTGDVWAYYEWMPYNYSCISEDKAMVVYRKIQEMFAKCGAPKIHLLMLTFEGSLRRTFEDAKALVKGGFQETACDLLDQQEEYLEEQNGGSELLPRFFVGFQLSGGAYESEERVSLRAQAALILGDFFRAVNEGLGDYTKVSNKEVERYLRMEKLLRTRIRKLFRMRRADPKDIAYIIRHLNGDKRMYEDYDFYADRIVKDDETRLKTYDVLRLADAKLVNHDRHIELVTEEGTEYVSYLAFSEMTGENEFPYNSEILYYMQEDIPFPVDVSIQAERMENRAALDKVRGKKAEMADLDENAYSAGSQSSHTLYEASEDTEFLEARLEKTKESMYRMNYLVRVSAGSEAELKKRVLAVKDMYQGFHMVLECPLCDQAGFHEEFYPSSSRYLDDYIQYVTSDFLAGLGFGAAQRIGEKTGIYAGRSLATGAPVFINPMLAAQGVEGSVTNALAMAYIGSLGGGKSLAVNLHVLWSVLFGGMGLVIDPKGERGKWKEHLGFLGEQLNLIDVYPGEENRGMFDPFYIMDDPEEAKKLAVNILCRLTGISAQDGERFPCLYSHVEKVANYTDQPKGLLCVIDELRKTNTKVSNMIATHIESFKSLSISVLLFGDGTQTGVLDANKALNVVMVQELMLPENGKPFEQYSISELLSVIILMVVSMYSLRFIRQDRSVFKMIVLDEAWSWLQVSEGKELGQRLVREGRAMNASIAFCTQNCDDLLDEKMKNNIGMKFAFRSTDPEEIRKTLLFMGLEHTDQNVELLRGLGNGECLFCDIYGHCGVVYIDYVFREFFEAFDTRPPVRASGGGGD